MITQNAKRNPIYAPHRVHHSMLLGRCQLRSLRDDGQLTTASLERKIESDVAVPSIEQSQSFRLVTEQSQKG